MQLDAWQVGACGEKASAFASAHELISRILPVRSTRTTASTWPLAILLLQRSRLARGLATEPLSSSWVEISENGLEQRDGGARKRKTATDRASGNNSRSAGLGLRGDERHFSFSLPSSSPPCSTMGRKGGCPDQGEELVPPRFSSSPAIGARAGREARVCE